MHALSQNVAEVFALRAGPDARASARCIARIGGCIDRGATTGTDGPGAILVGLANELPRH